MAEVQDPTPFHHPSGGEQPYRDLVENSLGFVCSHTLDGSVLVINRAAAEALGYTPAELEGANLRDLVPKRLKARLDRYFERVSRYGAARGYIRLMTRDGNSVTWLYRNNVYRPSDSGVIVIAHAQDVTWRLRTERRLRDTNENYRRLFDDAPVAYHEIDRRGVVVRLNRAECELLGCEKEDLVGRRVWELVAPELQGESKHSVLRKLAGDQPLVPFTREYVRQDGNRLVLRIHENLIRSGDGEILGIRSTLLDVTEQHRAEAELRRLNAELDKRVAERTAELKTSNERMREFIYTVSHDLQEPLRSIGAFARLLRERYTRVLDTDGLEFLDYVVSGTVHMSKLIQDLLAYSRVLHDQQPTVEPVPVSRAIEIATGILSNAIATSGARVVCGELPVVPADPNRLVQLFQNLIGNAIKYRGEGPPVIQIDCRKEAASWIISIADNGIGVQPADRERIFGLFKRTHRSTEPGSGVGLAICHAIVERHGGRIWVEPGLEGGSVFYFTIPCL